LSLAWLTPNMAAWWSPSRQQPETLDRIQTGQSWRGLAFSPDGTRLVWTSDGGRVLVATLASQASPVPLVRSNPIQVLSLAFASDGTLAAGQQDGGVALWDAARIRFLATLSGCPGLRVTSVAWSPDAVRLASASRTGTLCVWEPGTRRLLVETSLSGAASQQQATQTQQPIWRVVWDPQDEWIAASGGDGTLVLRSSTTGALLGEPLPGHAGNVYSLAASPDGSLLASGDERGQVILWDMSAPAAPKPLMPAPLAVSDSPVWGLSWTETRGTLLLAAGDDAGRIRVYEISTAATPTGPLEVVGCQLAGRKALTEAEWQQYLADEPYRATCGA
jgi:WD40 repeat protein